MNRRRILLAAVPVVVGMLAVRAPGDEVQFKNGDRVTGTIESIDSGKLVISTKVGGKLTADLKDVQTFSTDHPMALKLADGTVIDQPVSAGPAGQVMVMPLGAAGPRPVELSQIKKLYKPGAQWSGDVQAGGFLARGNTDSDSFNASLHLTRRGEQDRLLLNASYIFGRERVAGSGKHETANDLLGEAKYDYFFSEKAYAFGDVVAEHDTIAGLDLRLVPTLGVGYQWIEKPNFSFNTDAGVSYIHRQFAHDGSDDTVAAQLAYHLTWKASDKVSVFHDLEYYPALSRIDNYFFTANAGVRASLTEKMFTQFTIQYRYDSVPAPGHGPNDVRYILSVGWNL